MSLVAEHHRHRDRDVLVDLHPVLRRRRRRGRGRRGAGPSAPGRRRGGARRRPRHRDGFPDRQRGAADVLGDPGRRRLRRLVHRARARTGDRHASCRASATRPRCRWAPTRPSPDAPAPSRRSCSTPPPTCTGSMWRWTSSRASAGRRSSARSSDLVDAMGNDTERARDPAFGDLG